MMDVTKSTFLETLPEIERVIKDASFLSIDCELTGLNTVSNINAFDTPKQYYHKVYNSSKDFLVIQFGLCAFRYDTEENIFKEKAYNFYIFPRPSSKWVPDHRFLCQSSSLEFLIRQGFDFNKLFKEGIPYLNTQEEDKYREKLEDARNIRSKQQLSPLKYNPISISEDDQPFIDRVQNEIETFIESDEAEHVLPKCNAFLRRLIYQSFRSKFDNRASLETRELDNKERVLVVTRPKTLDDKILDEDKKIKKEEYDLQMAIGFSKIMRCISESRKLVIGHNMLLDTFHCINKFLTTLPDDYEAFKECFHCIFPNILDTKHMASSAIFKDLINSTVLSQLVRILTTEPFSLPTIEHADDSPSYSISCAKEHEAGYDAYITGICFISMWKYLGDHKKMGDSTFTSFNLLKPYVNRIFLMRIQDIPYMQLDGPDSNPPRGHVFYLTFPKEWKLNDIMQLFSPFGNVYVSWVDERSAYVALYRRDQHQAAIALSTLSQSDTYHIMTYAKKQALGDLPAPARKAAKQTDGFTMVKKRRSNISGESSVSKRTSIESEVRVESMTVEHTDDVTVPVLIKPRKRTISKTFTEDNSWE